MNKLLSDLKIDNSELLLEFLVAYSRTEYALKRAKFTTTDNGDAFPEWGQFISANKTKFNPDKNEKLKNAVEYLFEFPAKKQVIKDGQLDFTDHPDTQKGPELCRIYHCLRITRNNLFHGGKFPHGPEHDISRNKKLIENCLIALKEIVQLDQTVNNFFWEVE